MNVKLDDTKTPAEVTTEVPNETPEVKETQPEEVTSTPEVPSEGASYYKKMYEESQAELKKAQFTLNKKRLEEKETPEEVTKEETPVVPSAEEIAKKVRAEMQAESDAKAVEALSSTITDDDERTEVLYNLEHVIKPSGDINKDIQVAMKLAGVEKLEAVNSELAKASANNPKTAVLNGNAPKDAGEPLSKKDKSFMDAIDMHK